MNCFKSFEIRINQMILLYFLQSGRQIVGREDERVVSRGQNGRATINGRKDKYEEHKNSSATGA